MKPRAALRLRLASFAVLLPALPCGGSGGSGSPDGGGGPPDLGPRSTFATEADAVAARSACKFKAGDAPGLSLVQTAPLGPQIPIDTVVVLMMENRSFDHLL